MCIGILLHWTCVRMLAGVAMSQSRVHEDMVLVTKHFLMAVGSAITTSSYRVDNLQTFVVTPCIVNWTTPAKVRIVEKIQSARWTDPQVSPVVFVSKVMKKTQSQRVSMILAAFPKSHMEHGVVIMPGGHRNRSCGYQGNTR